MKNGFTLIEILVCITIIAVLIAILFPVITNSKRDAYKTTCQSNLKTIGQVARMYADDNDGQWADHSVWVRWNQADNVYPPTPRPASYPRLAGCPLLQIPPERVDELSARGYINGYAVNLAFTSWNYHREIVDGEVKDEHPPVTDRDIVYPATTVLFCDAALDVTGTGAPDPFSDASPYPYNIERAWERHKGGGNYLFCDGHVKLFHKDDVLPVFPFINDGTKPSFALSTRPAKQNP